ncbi:MAG TPA: MarR family winged helix-turn-helix transcriptional regulator [Actinomycetota bacterium]|nr:MarR family winged helix-turn-helix transcriptional regulator [Actinomycetota bacterium]
MNDGPATLPRQSSLGYQVNHLARLMAQALRERIAPFGVVPGQFAQLLALYEQDGLSQRELCERVRIEQPTMANTLQRMERDGLIRRLPDPVDGRRAAVMLTGRARDLEDDLVGAARGINSQAARNIGDDELANFIDTLSRIIDNLGAIPERRGADPAAGSTPGLSPPPPPE